MPTRNFTDKQVAEIRSLYADHGLAYAAIGERYGVSKVAIHKIVTRKAYKCVKP